MGFALKDPEELKIGRLGGPFCPSLSKTPDHASACMRRPICTPTDLWVNVLLYNHDAGINFPAGRCFWVYMEFATST